MKAKDLRTLEAFLAEYSGTSTSAGAGQKSNIPPKVGMAPPLHNAKKEKERRDANDAGLSNPDIIAKGSVGEFGDADQNSNGTGPSTTAATQANKAPEVNNPTGAQGLKPTDPPEKSDVTGNPVKESDKKIFKKKGAFGRSAVGGILRKKLPTGKLLKEADPLDFIVEINFNNKEVVKKALNGPVNCGFEAELIFPDIEEFDAYDDDYGDSTIERIANSEHESEIRELYRKTLLDYDNAYGEAFFEFQMDQMRRDFEDEEWVNDFVDDNISNDEVEEYKKEKLDDLSDSDDEEYEERVEWEDDAWGRELAELNYADEMQDYWMELLDDYKLERLIFNFEYNIRYGIENWIEDSGEAGNEYWSDAQDLLDSEYSEHSGESKKEKAYEEVESWLFDWAKMNSHNADIRVGGYHETTGHDGWRVEEDSSLQGEGQGFEVISPVYDTPKEMLAEIKSLFEYAQGDVDTNRSTGLHITMSYAKESEVPANIAKTKMYVLSGADNQAKVWGREFNTYSQNTKIQVLKALRSIATGNASEDNIKTMDNMIEKFNASSEAHKIERQSTVNIKRQTNSEGNNLVEFRAAGGPAYIDDFGQVAKDVTRYSATLVASYDPDAYNREFAKKMYKWLQDAADVEDPQAYSSTRGLSPQDVYQQSTGDTTFDVDNHPLTNYMMKFTHSTFTDNVKQALTRFFTSLKNQQEYAAKHNLNEYEEDPQEVYADFQFSTREALTNLLGYLALSPATDKMNTKELMAIRKLIRQYGVDTEEFVKALARDTGNPRLIPDPRDKADRTRIYKRAGRLIGKDLMGDAPEPMAMFIAPSEVALITADGVRYMQQYGETDGAYLPMSKNDYNFIKHEIDGLNAEFAKSKANPDDVELDTDIRKEAFRIAKDISTRFNKELSVERVAMRNSDGGLQYALLWQNQIARPHTDPLPAQQLKQIGVEVKPTEEKEAPFENLMSKFEGKSLVEQLTILEKMDKRKIDEAHNKTFKKSKIYENAVPNNSKVNIIKKLLSEHFPAGDLGKQMEAFSAIPMPEMIDDFRSVRRQSGDDGCCRAVLRNYIKYMHPTLVNEIQKNSDENVKNKNINEKQFNDYKNILNEAGMSKGELAKRNNFITFKRKITSSSPFTAVDGSEVIIAPSLSRKLKTIDDLDQFVSNRQIMLPLKNNPRSTVALSSLLKTAEFGGTAKKESGVANRGELAEGVLGAATFARIAKRPGDKITYNEVLQILNSLPKTQTGGTITKTVKGQDSVTDKISLTVRLGANTYADLIDTQKLTSDNLMNSYIKSTVQFVNDYTRLYANFFEKNGRPDEVEIVSDGVSENTDRKTDVYMIYVDEAGNRALKHFDISLKAGTVKQFGQVGYGRSASPIETRFAKVMELFNQFGIDQNLFKFDPKQFQNDDGIEMIKDLYKQAVGLINQKIGGDNPVKEYNYLDELAKGITYFATSNDPTVKLLQLDKGRYFVLDFKKLRPKLDNIDLEAQYAETTAGDPIVRIQDKNNPKPSGRLLQIRTKQDNNGYVRQILEKEPMLKKLISVRHVGDIER